MRNTIARLAAALAPFTVAFSQAPLTPALSDASLEIAIELGCRECFPGEDPLVRLTVTNISPETLTVNEPFHPASGYLTILYRDRQLPDVWRQWNTDLTPRPVGPPNISLLPGERRTRELRLSEACGTGDLSTVCELPDASGERFRLAYHYGKAGIVHRVIGGEFSIVFPTLEQWAEAELGGDFSLVHVLPSPAGPDVAKTETRRQYLRAAILSHQGKQYLVSSPAILVNPRWSPPNYPVVFHTHYARQLAPYHRIAEPIEGSKLLTVEIASNGDASISYVESDRKKSVRMTADRIRARKPERK